MTEPAPTPAELAAAIVALDRRLARLEAASAVPGDASPPAPERVGAEPAAPDSAAGSVIGATVEILYTDANDEQTQRLITIRAMGPPDRAPAFRAFCHSRGAMRTFRLDRIEEVIDSDGEILPDASAYLAKYGVALPAGPPATAANRPAPAPAAMTPPAAPTGVSMWRALLWMMVVGTLIMLAIATLPILTGQREDPALGPDDALLLWAAIGAPLLIYAWVVSRRPD